jgi:hypothetical protein
MQDITYVQQIEANSNPSVLANRTLLKVVEYLNICI